MAVWCGSSEDCCYVLSTQDPTHRTTGRTPPGGRVGRTQNPRIAPCSRTLELELGVTLLQLPVAYGCPNLMHEFEFEVRISDQIQTATNGSWAKFEILFKYYEFALAKNCPGWQKNH